VTERASPVPSFGCDPGLTPEGPSPMYEVPAKDTDAAFLLTTVECLLKQLRQEQAERAQEFVEWRSALTSLSAEVARLSSNVARLSTARGRGESATQTDENPLLSVAAARSFSAQPVTPNARAQPVTPIVTPEPSGLVSTADPLFVSGLATSVLPSPSATQSQLPLAHLPLFTGSKCWEAFLRQFEDCSRVCKWDNKTSAISWCLVWTAHPGMSCVF